MMAMNPLAEIILSIFKARMNWALSGGIEGFTKRDQAQLIMLAFYPLTHPLKFRTL